MKGKALPRLVPVVLLALSLAAVGPAPAADPQGDFAFFNQLLAQAAVRQLLAVDTVAGKTKVLVTSPVEKPALVIVHAAGGEGNPNLAEKDGLPYTKKAGNPMYLFGVAFLKKNVAWCAVDVPADFGTDLSFSTRLNEKHVEAFAQAAGGIKRLFPAAKLILMGHSNGGITAAMQAIQPKSPFDGIVLASPNLSKLPFDLTPKRVKVPLMFITHLHDNCPSTHASQTIAAAGRDFPVVVIDKASSGHSGECRKPPAPHFFSYVQDEMAAAVIEWAGKL